ncbi:MAG: hypothetical protein RMJ84_03955 [Sandaracinaceae bacterium]|nr:hypothetical protein [Sandaracinaceae bacterium]
MVLEARKRLVGVAFWLVVGPLGLAKAQEPPTTGAVPTSAQETPKEAPPVSIAPAPTRRVVIVDAATVGVAPVVGRAINEQMYRTAAEMGYAITPIEVGVQAFRALRLRYPPSPAALWRLAWATQSHRAMFARCWAEGGQYVVEVIVASLDGTGPFVASERTGSEGFRAAVDRAIRQALPLPAQWVGPEPQFTPQFRGAWAGGLQTLRRSAFDELAHPAALDQRKWRPEEPGLRRFGIALQTEGSIGTTEGSFYNHFAGLRFDLRLNREIGIGTYVAYVNLEGRNGRGHNMLFLVQGEYRLRPSPTLNITVPLRLGGGYLPYNGPVIRGAAGLNYAFSPNWEVGLDLIAPTIYLLASGPVAAAVAFNFALEGIYRF